VTGVSERVGSVRIGVAVTVVVVLGCTAYALATLDGDNRPLILAILGLGLAGGLSLLLLPIERIVQSRWREAFFLTWSAFDIALVAALAVADGGIGSPYSLVLTLPLVFAAASYPPGPFIAVAGMTVLSVIVLGVAGNDRALEYDVFFAFALGALGLLCAWQARDQAARRAAMAEIETALAETERAAAAILETAYEAYVAIDDRGLITNWNRRAEAMFGYSRAEALGRELAETIIPEDFREPHRRGMQRFIETGEGPLLGKRIVMSALGPDGREFPVELSISAVESSTGHSFHAFLEDISARQAAEHQLRESEERFRTLIQGATDYALFPLDPEGIIEDWNEGAQRLYGYSSEEICGYPVTRLLAADDETDYPSELRRAAEEGRAEFEGRRVRADGTTFVANVVLTPLRARSGRLRGFVAVVRDITERRRAEHALREAEERFRGAFEAAPVGIALVDLSPPDLGRFLQVNAALCEIAGRSAEDLLATTLQEISHAEDVAAELDLLRDLLGGAARHHSIESRLVRPEGEVVWASVSASIVRDPTGSPLYAVVQVQDVSERKRFEGQLQYLADHDPLTGLYNRRRFEQELRQQVALADRHGSSGAVLVIDLDNFKYINDTLGHAVGDELIGRVGTIVNARLRSTDTVARLGGDEFAVLLPETPPEEAVRVADELRSEIGAQSVVGGGRSMRLTVSIGVSRFGRDAKVSADGVLVNADIAMYEAKAGGRDRVEILEAEGPKTKMRARLTWSERIRDALENGRFELFQQPILELEPNAVTRHELLLRMRDGGGDLIAPSSFLYIAEQFGQIQAIDRWVCGEAIELLETRQREGDDICLEVNLSGTSITDPEMSDFLEAAVRDADIDATKLIFEVTETAAIVNIEKARQFAARMADLGCSFALDDFGAGFGSFYYLKHLPFDYLKIDGDFIAKLPVSAADRLTVEAIVRIARGLGKRTIAEFVGDEPTVELLRDFGVDFAQGYHVGRPVPVSETWTSAPQEA
jgi:diguanylate cyclase (GGDEF)-like protein/PAS domain S-box-containing protein